MTLDTELTRTTALVRTAGACWGWVDGRDESQLALWSPQQRRLHLLNATAAAAWELVGQPLLIDDLVDGLAQTYQVSAEVVRADIEPVLHGLVAAGLLRDSDSPEHAGPPRPINLAQANERPLRSRTGNSGSTTIGPIRALDCPMLVDVHDPELFDALVPILDPLLDSEIDLRDDETCIRLSVRPQGSGWAVERNGVAATRAVGRGRALRAVLGEVNSAPLHERTNRVVLHSAGIEFGAAQRGSIVLFPGISNSGKSTLAAQLVVRGHGYITDEALAITCGSTWAQPFHKALCIEPSGHHAVANLEAAATQPRLSNTWDIDPRKLGGGYLSNGGEISSVVFPTYTEGAETALCVIEPLDALQRLIANAFDFTSAGPRAFETLLDIANNIPAYTLIHGGDGSQIEVLEATFGSSAQKPVAP